VIGARVVSARQRGLGSPRLDPGGQAARLISELSREDFPEAALDFTADGQITWGVEDRATEGSNADDSKAEGGR